MEKQSSNREGERFYDLVQDLARDTQSQWRAKGCRTEVLPEVAHSVLTKAALHRAFDSRSLIDWFFTSDYLPQQFGAGHFGQPPLTLFNDGKLLIEALFWQDAETSVHDHSFSGAFAVVSGESLHSTYVFENVEQVDGELRVGELTPVLQERIALGAVRPIEGGKLIHQVWHLDRPTVSLVVRSTADRGGLQHNYWPRNVATVQKPEWVKDSTEFSRMQKALRMISRDKSWLDAFVKEQLTRLPPVRVFELLRDFYRLTQDEQRLRNVAKTYVEKRGTWASLVVNSARDIDLLDVLPGTLKSQAKRVLVGLLCSCPDLEAVESALRVHWGIKDPQGHIAETLRSLTAEEIANARISKRVFSILSERKAAA